MKELLKDVEQFSSCCEASVAEYNATGTPVGVPVFSRCSSCHEMAEVVFITPEGKELTYHDAYRSTIKH